MSISNGISQKLRTMEFVTFNAIIYVLALLVYWYKRRKIDVGFVLISLYSLVAILGIPLYATTANDWKISLWPYLYMFVVLMLFFRPFFFDSDSLYEKIYVRNYQIINVISILYIVCAFISIYYMWPQAVENLKSGKWGDIRTELYTEGITMYAGQTERFVKIFAQYFNIVALVILFYFLTFPNIKPLKIILLAIAVTIPTFLTALLIASRGLLFNLFINFLIVYIIFRKEIPPNVKRLIGIIAFSFLIIILFFSISVTRSRFGEANQSASLLYYFGHSFLRFNYGVADSISSYAGGAYLFDWFINLFNLDSTINYNSLGTHFGTSFITFVGTLYIDFGPIGTFLIAIVAPWLISRSFRHKETIDFADVFLYIFYLTYLLNGVFIVGKGSALSWLIAILIYRLLKIRRLKLAGPNNASTEI